MNDFDVGLHIHRVALAQLHLNLLDMAILIKFPAEGRFLTNSLTLVYKAVFNHQILSLQRTIIKSSSKAFIR